jgi:hypothetical protein
MSVRPETYVVPYGVNAQYPILKDGSVLKLVNELGEDIEVIATNPGPYQNPTKTLVTKAALSGLVTDTKIDILRALREGSGNPMTTPSVVYTYLDPFFAATNNFQTGFTFDRSPLYPNPRITGTFNIPSRYDNTRPNKIVLRFSASSVATSQQYRMRIRLQRMTTGSPITTLAFDLDETVVVAPSFEVIEHTFDLPIGIFNADDNVVIIISRNETHPDDTSANPVFLVGAIFEFED